MPKVGSTGSGRGGAEGVASSLVPNRESVPDILARICPKKAGWWLVSQSTGQQVPMGCGTSRCPVCGPSKARATAGAIGLAEPERFFTLTLVGDQWQTVRDRMKNLRCDLSKEVGPFEIAWHVEPNPLGTGHHVHAWQRGRFVRQAVLSRCADRRGMGRVADIRKWKPIGGPSVTYGLKLAGIGYGLKMTESTDSFDLFMRSNGERFVHASRNYWRNAEHERCSLREARQSWSHESADDEGPWVARFEPSTVVA